MPVHNIDQYGKLRTLDINAHLLLAGLEQESDPVGVVVHGEVGQPGAGVGVHHDLVPALHIDDDVLPGHRVLVVVLVVLVEDGGDLLTVLTDGKESLLVIVGGNVELGGWKLKISFLDLLLCKTWNM